MSDGTAAVLEMILMFILGFGLGGAVVSPANSTQREAIKTGFAHYVSDEAGWPKFEWVKPDTMKVEVKP